VSRVSLLLPFLVLTTPVPSSAQHAASTLVRPIPSPIFGVRPEGPLGRPALGYSADTLRQKIPPTHWKAGAVIGGLTGGLGLALFAAGFCRYSENASQSCVGPVVGSLVIGATMGGTLGALIGGQISRTNAAD
jgi:hypothetical protein